VPAIPVGCQFEETPALFKGMSEAFGLGAARGTWRLKQSQGLQAHDHRHEFLWPAIRAPGNLQDVLPPFRLLAADRKNFDGEGVQLVGTGRP
jgi:hypothetical protein